MKLISIVCGTFNEEDNVPELLERITRVFHDRLPKYGYEIIVIDNSSEDNTVAVLKQFTQKDKRVKLIVNNRNFGHIRSGYHAIQQATGEAVVSMSSDLQDPPEMIVEFVDLWEKGFKIVLAQKTNSKESPLFFLVRKLYYYIIGRLSEIDLVKNATGFGLYDRRVVEEIRKINDPYPYFRGLICDLGFERALVPFTQPARMRGFTKNNLYTLYDNAMLGITNHSKVPLRLAAFTGFCIGALSFGVALAYLIYKLVYWNEFQVGTAPLVIGLFFLGAIQLFFVGILGEYIGSIHTQILRRPAVIEKERVNFDTAEDGHPL